MMKARQQQKQTNRIRVRCPSTFSSDKAKWREYFTIDCNWLVLSVLFIFFPNSVSLGSSAIVKVPEQVGAAKSALRKVPKQVPRKRLPFPEKKSQGRFPSFPSKVPKRFPVKVSRKGFPSKVLRKRIPSKGSQEEVPKQGSQEQVPKQGSQARFPSKVPKQGSQARFPPPMDLQTDLECPQG